MVTKKDILKELEEKSYKPVLFRELMRLFKVMPRERRTFKRLIQEMLGEGSLVKTRGRRYGLPQKMNLVTGRLQGHPEGYGFVIPEKEDEPHVYISNRNMLDAMHGDKVVARIEGYKKDGRREGRIIRILERAHTRIVGRYESSKTFGYLTPFDKRIFHDLYIPKDNGLKARNGEIAVAEITKYPTASRNPEGRIIAILGREDAPGIETEIVVEEYELPREFPKEVLREARSLPLSVTEEMLKDRVNLRHLNTVTIDGEQARDFDDAVSVEKLQKNRIRLWVHIADVSHYVKALSLLDKEAFGRGTSVYFPNRVIPMFPFELSNEICSLNPNADRLTMTTEMVFGPSGERLDYKIYKSVIRSRERMTYTAVKEILVDKKSELLQRYKGLIKYFEIMHELCLRLKNKRMERGSIDFDLPEPELIIDIQGQTTGIIPAERTIAHQIIEEFMIAANEAVASHITSLGTSFIYRIHEEPDTEKMVAFNDFILRFGLNIEKIGKVSPKILQKMLERIRNRPEERLINNLMLRSMKQARYSTTNLGHFGLASENYTHFTSPIRRYPDLIVQRLLKGEDKFITSLPEIARQSSERERVAMDAEREVMDMKKLQFMTGKVGEDFEGFITGVASFGLFVEIKDLFVQGLVHVSTLHDDYYIFLEREHCLTGEHSRKIYRIGDKVWVRVARVDLQRRLLDFVLIMEKKRQKG